MILSVLEEFRSGEWVAILRLLGVATEAKCAMPVAALFEA